MAAAGLPLDQLEALFGPNKPASLATLLPIMNGNSATRLLQAHENLICIFVIGSMILIASASRRPWESLYRTRLELNSRALNDEAGSFPADVAASGLTVQAVNGSREAACFHCGVSVSLGADAAASEVNHATASPNCYLSQLHGLLNGSAVARQAVSANAERFGRALRKLSRDLRDPVVTNAESFGFSRSNVTFAATRHFMLNGGAAHDKPGSLIQCVHDCQEEFGKSAELLDKFNVEQFLLLLDLAESGGSCGPNTSSAAPSTAASAASASVVSASNATPEAASSASGSASASQGEDGDSEGSDRCVMCKQRIRDRVLLPCAHFCACSGCLTKVTRCPVCNASIIATVRAFIS